MAPVQPKVVDFACPSRKAPKCQRVVTSAPWTGIRTPHSRCQRETCLLCLLVVYSVYSETSGWVWRFGVLTWPERTAPKAIAFGRHTFACTTLYSIIVCATSLCLCLLLCCMRAACEQSDDGIFGLRQSGRAETSCFFFFLFLGRRDNAHAEVTKEHTINANDVSQVALNTVGTIGK